MKKIVGIFKKDWENISPDFTKELKREWKKRGFVYEEVRDWIGIGLEPADANYVYWLKNIKKVDSDWVLNYGNDKSLRKQYDDYSKDHTENGLGDRWQTEFWIKEDSAEFSGRRSYEDLYNPLEWKKYGFTSLKAQSWIESGILDPYKELGSKDAKMVIKLVKLLISQGYTPKEVEGRAEEVWNEIGYWLINPENYLNFSFSHPQKSVTRKLKLNDRCLVGELDLKDFINLEELYCGKNKLTHLDVSKCNNLRKLHCSDNQLIELNLARCNKLEYLDCSKNDQLVSSLWLPARKIEWLVRPDNKFEADYAEWLESIKKKDIEWIVNYGKDKELRREFEKFLEGVAGGSKLRVETIGKILLHQIQCFNINKERQLTPEQLSMIGKKLIPNEELRERYQKYGLCRECCQPNTSGYAFSHYFWCQSCNSQHFVQDFDKWTSGNPAVDKFIQKSQLEATNKFQVLEWIPHEQFTDVKFLAEGGFSRVYKAKWTDGPIHTWNVKDNKWERGIESKEVGNVTGQVIIVSIANAWNIVDHKKMERIDRGQHGFYEGKVVLKILNNSQNMTVDFLQEITYHKLFDDNQINWIVKCYGISQDPITKNYIMVMQYMKNGDLRRYLDKYKPKIRDNRSFHSDTNKFRFSGYLRRQEKNEIKERKKSTHYKENLLLENKLTQLQVIAAGLSSIHEKGLIHRDLHAGNILGEETRNNHSGIISFYITDLGLCRPANENDRGKIYGVLPYVDPEVLRKKIYTQAADIYSFGIVAYELLANSYPYADLKLDDTKLALAVCQGLRPKIEELSIPQLLKDLIKRCWDADPKRRPIAEELCRVLSDLHPEENVEFTRQVQKAEEFSQTLPNSVHHLQHVLQPQFTYTSHLLNFKNLPQPQNSQETNDRFYNSQEMDINISEQFQFDNSKENLESQELDFITNNLAEIDISQDLQEQPSFQAKIEIPPK